MIILIKNNKRIFQNKYIILIQEIFEKMFENSSEEKIYDMIFK